MELIEKMARAMCAADKCDPDKQLAVFRDEVRTPAWQLYVDDAQAALTALIEYAGQDGVTETSTQDALDFIGTAMRNWRHARFDKEELEDFRVALQLRDARHRATAFAAGRAAREREIVKWLRELAAEYKRLRLTFQAADCNNIADAIERGEV